MAIFDSLIGEVSERFGLGAKASPLVMAALRYLTSERTGGLGGFLEKFQKVGLGDLAASWVSRGDNLSLSPGQLTHALGDDGVNHIARDAGLSANDAKTPLAYAIPRMVDALTPNGTVPSVLPASVLALLGGAGAAAAGGAVHAAGAGVRQESASATAAAATGDTGGSFLYKLLPLLALGLLAVLGYQYCTGEPPKPPATANANAGAHSGAPATTNNNAPAKPKIESSLVIVNRDGKYFVTGVVPDQKTKDELEAQLKAAYGEGKYDISGVKIDANAKAPGGWWAKLKDILPTLAVPGAILSFDGPNIKLEGVKGDAGTALLGKLKGIFGGDFNVTLAVPVNEAAAAEEAEKKATTALGALGDNFTPAQLQEALNLQIINFASNSPAIPKDREDLLTESAKYIKKLPANAVTEVGGHTDSKGNAATNSKLSQARADAVKAFLVKAGVNAAALTTKGYGPSNPVASNDTEDGRFKNRRIQYTITTK